jgi:peptidoglycan/LPS O-acetylase OafA/YrhL
MDINKKSTSKFEYTTSHNQKSNAPKEGHKNPNKRILEFDVLRSIAIILLFFHHGGIYNFSIFGFPLSPLTHYVELFLLGSFIFMAGYLTVGSLEKKRENAVLDFIRSKVIRIYVPYLGALALFILLLGVKVSKTDLAAHLLGAQILLAPRETHPIFTLWYVGLILVYYVLFSILLKYIPKTGTLLLAFILIFGAAFLVRMRWDFIERRFFYYFFVYASGILCAKTNLLTRMISTRYFLIDKLIIFGIGVAVFTPFHVLEDQALSLPLVLSINLYVVSAVLLALNLSRLLVSHTANLRLFSYISTASFFAYLLHRPVWKILGEFYSTHSIPIMFTYLTLVGSTIVLVVSYYLQKLYNNYADSLDQLLVRYTSR